MVERLVYASGEQVGALDQGLSGKIINESRDRL